MNHPEFKVLIVGGGFSGSMLAVQLSRRLPNLPLAIVDTGAAPGRGLAYGTKYRCHLLNVPAGNMSALAEEPDHFLSWARANYEPSVQDTSFLPRGVYGQYVGSLIEEVAALGNAANFRWIQGEACGFEREPSHISLQLRDGRELTTQTVVLAAGNFPPANLNIPGISERSLRYMSSAWSANAAQDIPKNGSVLLIGSGLTSIDLAVALKSEGFTGNIHILSRRGLIPQTHCPAYQWPQFWNDRSPRTTRGLLRLVREQVRAASEAGVDWRAVIDALRPATQEIWQSLPLAERKRFLRHVRSYWEVHRHRIAPEIGDTIADLMHRGRIRLYAGRVTNYREHGDFAEVRLRERKTRKEHAFRVDRVINCTGPETNCRRVDSPLIKHLLAQGLARPDSLSLGLDADADGALIDSRGTPSAALYAIGPARKGALWETTAVPEIRIQASQLAEHLARTLGPHSGDADSATSGAEARDFTAVAANPRKIVIGPKCDWRR